MDYAIWESLIENVYLGQRKKFSEPELKTKILESWQELTIEEIRKCISILKKNVTERYVNSMAFQLIT